MQLEVAYNQSSLNNQYVASCTGLVVDQVRSGHIHTKDKVYGRSWSYLVFSCDTNIKIIVFCGGGKEYSAKYEEWTIKYNQI